MLETFKTLTISKAEMERRCPVDAKARDVLRGYAERNQSIMLVLGHWGNWEWAGNTFSLVMQHQLFVIYHPLSNKYFDGLMFRMRTRFGTKLIPMQQVFRDMVANRRELTATAFIADQTPQPDNAFWTKFLSQDTPFFKGPEVIARKLNLPVVYVAVHRLKRGYYSVSASTITDDPGSMPEEMITERFKDMLERDINSQPEIWLWSHRRWKHKRQGLAQKNC
jgi:KDO2-lipid IV(A) lauroyltransferase